MPKKSKSIRKASRADAGGGTAKPIDSGLIARVLNAVGSVDGEWLGPGQANPQVSPPGSPVRDFDYETLTNSGFQPRSTELFSFQAMRNLADGYYLLRLAIETRKDQIEAMPWEVRIATQPGENAKKVQQKSIGDPRVKKIRDLLKFPDGQTPWNQWIRMIAEELLVTDAVSILPRRQLLAQDGSGNPGDVMQLEAIDGATIRRVIDYSGRTPAPPNAAYQQVIHGQINANLSVNELLYMPRNKRVYKIYGYSPVEQIIFIVNVALRRAIHQLNYYTEGNIPEALVQVPSDWNREDTMRFQNWFDKMLRGNLAARRRLIFIPGSGKGGANSGITFTKEQNLKDEMDEWLARVICWCFSLPHTALVKGMNRAESQQQSTTADKEGLMPTLMYLQNVINVLIQSPLYMNMPDVEFCFKDNTATDVKVQMDVDTGYVKAGVMSIDEVREKLGLEPVGVDVPCIQTLDGHLIPVDVAIETGETVSIAAADAAENPPEPQQVDANGNPIATPPKGKGKNAPPPKKGAQEPDASTTTKAFTSDRRKDHAAKSSRRSSDRSDAS